MMKKMLFILGIVMAGNMVFAASDTSTVTLRAMTASTIVVDNIDFGDYLLGDPTPNDATGNIVLTGTASKDIRLSVPKSLELVNSASDKVAVAMSLENGTDKATVNESIVTLDGAGDGTSILTASLQAAPTIEGDYAGTATVTANYN